MVPIFLYFVLRTFSVKAPPYVPSEMADAMCIVPAGTLELVHIMIYR